MVQKLTCGLKDCQGVLKPGKIIRKGSCACNEEYVIRAYHCPKCKAYYELHLCSLITNPTVDQMQLKLTHFLVAPRIPTRKELKALFKKHPTSSSQKKAGKK